MSWSSCSSKVVQFMVQIYHNITVIVSKYHENAWIASYTFQYMLVRQVWYLWFLLVDTRPCQFQKWTRLYPLRVWKFDWRMYDIDMYGSEQIVKKSGNFWCRSESDGSPNDTIFLGTTVEVWEWISNFISHVAGFMITYPYNISKRAPMI